MEKRVRLVINGKQQEVAAAPNETLLQLLRNRLGLIGAKRACDSGGCGCCTVHVDGKAVYSCMTFVRGIEGSEVTTIEGLGSDGELDPLQAAFVEEGAVQCGYCSCGIIMAAKEFLATADAPSEEEIRHAIAGNLCRCTGYTKIVKAIKVASEAR